MTLMANMLTLPPADNASITPDSDVSLSLVEPVPYLVVTLITGVSGLTGNTLFCITLSSVKFRNLSYSVFFRYLAVVHSIVLLSAIYQHVDEFGMPKMRNMMDDRVFCMVFMLVVDVSNIASSWIMVVIAVDRLLAFSRPFLYFKYSKHVTRPLLVAMGVTIASAALHLPEVVAFAIGDYNQSSTDCFMFARKGNGYGEFRMVKRILVFLAFPIVITLILNVCLVLMIKRHRAVRKQLSSAPMALNRRRESRTSMFLVMVTGLSAILLIPVTLLDSAEAAYVHIYTNVDEHTKEILHLLQSISFIISLLYYSMNFYILLILWPSYRHDVHQTLCHIKCCCFWKRRDVQLRFGIQTVYTTYDDSTSVVDINNVGRSTQTLASDV